MSDDQLGQPSLQNSSEESQEIKIAFIKKKKFWFLIFSLVLLFVFLLAAGVILFSFQDDKKNEQSVLDFNELELGISFKYPESWGVVSKKTKASISDTPFDLEHTFTFAQNNKIVMNSGYIGEPEVFRQHADYTRERKLDGSPRDEYCRDRLEGIIEPASKINTQEHTPFRRYSEYSYGTCDEKIISYVQAKKISPEKGLVDLSQQITSTIEIYKIFIINSGNSLYSPLKIVAKLAELKTDDYCEADWGLFNGPAKMKDSDCITYQEKEIIEKEVLNFVKSESNKELVKLVTSSSIRKINNDEAFAIANKYFDQKTKFEDSNRGISFEYPSIFTTPVINEKNNSIKISDFLFVQILIKEDVIKTDKEFMDCANESKDQLKDEPCWEPYMNIKKWNSQFEIFSNNKIDNLKCKDCLTFEKIGNYEFLVLFEGGLGGGLPYYTGKKYIYYHNERRYEFNIFQSVFTQGTQFTLDEFNDAATQSLMNGVVKEILGSVKFI